MSKVRIVGGQWRSRLIQVPDAMGLRPTPDRVRETLFNWLGQDLQGKRCLDLFAGSGALGFEAASRGAAEVVMVESAAKVLTHLRDTKTLLDAHQVSIVAGDGLKYLAHTARQYDVIFLDPPYRQGWLEKVAPWLDTALAPDGYVYAESEYSLTQLGRLETLRTGKAGQVHFQLLSNPSEQASHE